ncbi:MAG: hypothetical protein DHS20C17_05850 [Cyclobacteriaceae bacterium]|nr:MAG: hypothetical protein DHS20C17_05850 [Cyclobacteriaceae bacterium]
MNYIAKNARLMMLALAAVFISASLYAAPNDPNSKTAEKARVAVEEAAPDDWHTYAESAEKCMRKKVNLAEAKQWLDRSLEIRQTPYNLAVMGDYYYMNQLPDKALEYYVRSLRVGMEQDITYQDPVTHAKMMKVRNTVIKRSK